MSNSQLYDNTYALPLNILKYIQTVIMSNPQSNGTKRAKYMLKNGALTYQALKRLKNFFDYFNIQTGDKIQYALAGGDLMKNFIETTLNQERAGTKRSTEVRRDIHANPNSELKPYQISRLTEADNKKKDNKKSELKRNTVAVIVNSDNKILLLKRAEIKGGWGNNQWSLVGGEIEKGESPHDAIQREIEEETGLIINKFIKTFNIQRSAKNKEDVFACRYTGDPVEIKLNDENTNYGWFDVNEIDYLDTVPNLKEYIQLCFIDY